MSWFDEVSGYGLILAKCCANCKNAKVGEKTHCHFCTIKARATRKRLGNLCNEVLPNAVCGYHKFTGYYEQMIRNMGFGKKEE